MANVLALTRDMPRDEWLHLRRRGIGGSDAAAVAGLSPWRSPFQVWAEKTGLIEPEEADSEAAYWGTVLEDVVAQEFTRRTGLRVRRRNAILKHPEYPWMIANIDRFVVGESAGLECKTTSAYHSREWDGDEVPAQYLIQVQHYMAVVGADHWYIAVLIGGQRFLHKKIERDDELIAQLIEIEAEFWHRVETGEPPEMDGSPASEELLKQMYPESKPGSAIALPSEAEVLIEEYLRAREEEKAASERKQAAENRLKQLMGEHEIGLIAGQPRVTWKNKTKRDIDSKRLKEETPDVYERFLKTVTYRTFSVK